MKVKSRLRRKHYRTAAGNQIRISDHVILRWMERVNGINLDPYRQGLMDYIRPHVTGKDCTFKTQHGEFIIRDGCLITIITKM